VLNQDEENYIRSIPNDKKVEIVPFSKRATELASEIISEIKKAAPDLEVKHLGASGLGISGQRDLDIYALTRPDKFRNYLSSLIKIFGKPKSSKADSIAWEFEREGYSIEFYLTDPNSTPMKRQITVFNILLSNQKLLKAYEKLKEGMNGKPLRDYQRKKYEFYHRILGE